MKPSEFVKAHYGYAHATAMQNGIAIDFTLADAATESGWGERAVGFNYFGIKWTKGCGFEKQLITTTEYHSDDKHVYPEIISITPVKPGRYKYVVKDYFRKYNSPAECFLDHARFFEENPRYAAALKVKGDAEKFAEAIAAAGYATGPGYAELLKAVIKMVRKELKKLNQ